MKKLMLPLAFLCGVVATLATPTVDAQIFRRFQAQQSRAAIPTTVAEIHVSQTVSASPTKAGPVFCDVVRIHLAKAYVKQGIGRLAALRKANSITDEEIAELIPAAERAAGVKVGAIGDGKILDAIIAFFQSPQGQALIEALIKMILSLLAVAPDPAAMWYSSLAAWNV